VRGREKGELVYGFEKVVGVYARFGELRHKLLSHVYVFGFCGFGGIGFESFHVVACVVGKSETALVTERGVGFVKFVAPWTLYDVRFLLVLLLVYDTMHSVVLVVYVTSR
jgi:hypothetical protein